MKRLFLVAVLAVAAVAVSAANMTHALCPEPRNSEISFTDYVPFESVTTISADAGALSWAKRHLKEWYGKLAPQVVMATGDTSAMGKEEYRVETDARGVRVKANTLQGVRYALYTLRQLAIPARGTAEVEGWIVPKAVIEDSPEMEFRGMHICWFRENEPWEIERLIRLAAYYKLNYAVIEPGINVKEIEDLFVITDFKGQGVEEIID